MMVTLHLSEGLSFPVIIIYLMNTNIQKMMLSILLTFTLLTLASNSFKWQGTGRGMNSTVITEIWMGLESNISTVINGSRVSRQALVKNISSRLNARWDPAWNVVLTRTSSQFDTILYGYAFRDQWMWYNGVPYATEISSMMATLVVWKDFNCQDWGIIGDIMSNTSSFTSDQRAAIISVAGKINQTRLSSDVWGAAQYMVTSLQQSPFFSSGALSVVMSQADSITVNGYACRFGNRFNYTRNFNEEGKGMFLLFQTR